MIMSSIFCNHIVCKFQRFRLSSRDPVGQNGPFRGPAMTSRLTLAMDRAFYPGHGDQWDDLLLRETILGLLRPGFRVLDLGAGAGRVAQMDFRGRGARVAGLDPDPRVAANPYLDEAHVGSGEDMRCFRDGEFDMVFSDNVLEHVARPGRFMGEVGRVLKPGGVFVTKTPNLRHYMPLVARCTPLWFHRSYNRLRRRAEADTFPTLYRLNTPAAQRRHADAAGLRVRSIRSVEGRPEYLRLSWLLYPFGIAYERLVNGLGLAGAGIILITVFERPS